jgi:hypothetical protein
MATLVESLTVSHGLITAGQSATVGTGLSLVGHTLSCTVTQYTDEQAQDAVGAMIADTATIDLTYTDATPELKADVKANSIGVALMHASATAVLFGRSTAGAGAGEEIAIGSGLSLSGGTLSATGGGSGTVTSVALTMPGIFSVAGSPVTTAGTLAVTLANQAANVVFAGPTTGGAAAPTFRALVTADLPASVAYQNQGNIFTVNQLIQGTDTGTNDVGLVLALGRLSSGTVANGFGVKERMQLQSSDGTLRIAAEVATSWASATDAVRAARYTITVYDTAAREAFRAEASGTAALIGFFGVPAVAQQSGSALAGLISLGLFSSATIAASDVTSGTLALARGGTGADLGATGGANQVVKQTSAGGAFTVGALVAADIPNLDAAKITTGTLAAARVPSLDALTAPAADVSLNSHKITNVTDPTNAQDAATKAYVDAASNGLDWKASVRVATTAALAANTRTGNDLDENANGALANIDGVSLAVNDRLLVKNEATGANNGLYFVASLGGAGSKWKLTRVTDADASAEVTAGLAVWAAEGTTNGDTAWVLTTNDPVTLNTTSLTFTQFGGVGTYTGSNGISVSGTVISPTYGTTAGTVTQGNDSRLSDARTPVGTALTSANLWLGSSGNVAAAVAMTGDVTITNAGVTAVGANKITDAMLRQGAATSVVGRSANSTGNEADIAATADGQVLRRSGSSLGFGDLRPPRSAQTASFTAATTETMYSLDASGGAITATLPAAASNDGLYLTFWHNTDPGANTAVIDGNASEVINGALTLTLYYLNDLVSIYCDGINWHVLTDNRARPQCQVKLSADLSIANSTVVAVAWTAEDYDAQGMHDTVTNNSRVTVKRPGKYLVVAFLQFEGATTAGADTGLRQALLYKTGVADIDLTVSASVTTGEDHIEIFKTYDLAAGDYVEVKAWQNSGNARKVMSQLSRLSVTFVGD